MTADAPKHADLPGTMTQALTLYGIPNCDTVKRARTWLAEQGARALLARPDHYVYGLACNAPTLSQWMNELQTQGMQTC